MALSNCSVVMSLKKLEVDFGSCPFIKVFHWNPIIHQLLRASNASIQCYVSELYMHEAMPSCEEDTKTSC